MNRWEKALRSERVIRYCQWKDYEAGFIGVGPTPFDKQPDFPKPTDIPRRVKKAIDDDFEKIAKFHRDTFNQVVEEMT